MQHFGLWLFHCVMTFYCALFVDEALKNMKDIYDGLKLYDACWLFSDLIHLSWSTRSIVIEDSHPQIIEVGCHVC